VLGRVAEVVTGQKLDDLFEERFFEPLGMTETGFFVREDQKARFASNYARTEEAGFVLQDDGQTSYYLKDLPLQSGGGGLVSTLEDYAKFSQMLLQKGTYKGTQILKPETVAMMTRNQLDANDVFMMEWLGSPDDTGFGYGGSVDTGDKEGRVKGMWGWGGMAKTNFHLDPDNGAYAVLMLQFFEDGEPQLHRDFKALVTEQVAD